MKCSKCQINERHGSLAYCAPCNAVYMKAYREAKQAKLEQPIITDKVEPKEDIAITKSTAPRVLWSYYIDKGTDLHGLMLKVESGMANQDILSQIQAIALSPFKGQARA